MFFLEEIKKVKDNYSNKIGIFIDMDGVNVRVSD